MAGIRFSRHQKYINGKPLWEIKMEMRALRQRFNLTDGQCSELLEAMQELALNKQVDPKYRINATRAILGMMRLDQISAIEVLKITGKQIDGIPEDEIDGVIDGELAELAGSPEAPPTGPNPGAEGVSDGEAPTADPDDPSA